ncbi:hypothetical protein AB3662_26925 [Sorangium cellulosum]|uniref:hypothetical protein n=1 Tax=Sorangium cellulosum TaxID=56 RepID=UPI003D9A63CF
MRKDPSEKKNKNELREHDAASNVTSPCREFLLERVELSEEIHKNRHQQATYVRQR